MYKLSFQSNSTNLMINETLNWYFNCKGHFGLNLVLTASVLCFTVGIPVHCCSLWVSLRGNIKPNLVFPLNIIVLELLFCIMCIVDIVDTFYSTFWSFQLLFFFVGLCWTVRPIIQICMCIEQYLAVIHPVTFLRYKNIQYRIGSAGAAWLIALGNSLRIIFFESHNFPDHLFMVLFCIAVIIVSYCCVSVLCALKRPGPGDQHNVEMTEKDRGNKTDRGRTGQNQQKRKAFQKISRILVSILICYMSLVITYIMIIAKMYKCNTVPMLISITIIAVFISSLVRAYGEGHLKHMFFKLRERMKGK